MELNKKGLPFFPELRFEDKRHIYTLGGQILPSVTTVMKPLDEALYRGIDESVMQMAAERGTAIHNCRIKNLYPGRPADGIWNFGKERVYSPAD